MAKRPRMGRNLDALLGGASRERTNGLQTDESGTVASDDASKPPQNPTAESAQLPQEPSTSHDVDNTVLPETRGGQLSSADPARSLHAVQPAYTVEPVSPADLSNKTTERIDNNAAPESTDTLEMIAVDRIRRGTYQPRRLFDQDLLQELADSIKTQGMIQPILVRSFAGAFELIAGERRWRAAQLAGLTHVPAIVREMPDQSVAAVALIENIQRKNLNPLEEAAAFERLCDEFGMTHKTVAESVGRSRASVSNLLRLLELHDEVKVLVDKGELEMGHARAILGAPKKQQFEIAQQVIKRGLTTRAVEKLVREINESPVAKKTKDKERVLDPDIERLSQKLSETLGASVRIQHKTSGAGTLEIAYSTVSELQGVLEHIK